MVLRRAIVAFGYLLFSQFSQCDCVSLTVVYLVTEGLQKPSFLVSHINHIFVSLTVKYKFSLITTTLCTGSDINETPLRIYPIKACNLPKSKIFKLCLLR